MFKPIEVSTDTVKISIDGTLMHVPRGDTVAAALLQAGVLQFRRSAVSGQPRGPYCMMGVCHECLVTIDDMPNQQACMRTVEPDMRVEIAR
jgi:D-hydroxyproline dehydrogenase subunit gamma